MENERKRDSISYEDFTEQHKKRKSIKNMSEIISYLNLHNLYLDKIFCADICSCKGIFEVLG